MSEGRANRNTTGRLSSERPRTAPGEDILCTAYSVLKKVTAEGAFANLALKQALFGAHPGTAAAVTALVYTTLENISYADYLISHYAKGRVQSGIKNVLRLSIVRLLFMDVPAHAAVNGAAELTRSIGKAALCGFVNGVMRSIARAAAENSLFPLPDEPAERLCVRFGIPKGLAVEYIEDYGFDFALEMLSSRVHELTVRAQYPFTTDALERGLARLGIAFRRGRYDKNALTLSGGVNAAELDLFKEGRLAVQSESAMLAVRACRAEKGMRVLDACAAPGGKSAYLASLMENTGSITAWEAHAHRTELMRSALKRLGVSCCECETRDASCAAFGGEGFDIVLVDAPCSGLGGGGKPDALLKRTDASIDELKEIQLKILLSAANFVKSGGALVYSTCTVSRRENELNIRRFLDERKDFEPQRLDWLIKPEAEPEPKPEAEPEHEPEPKPEPEPEPKPEHEPELKPEHAPESPASALPGGLRGEYGLQLFPNIDGMDGFYIARLVKKG